MHGLFKAVREVFRAIRSEEREERKRRALIKEAALEVLKNRRIPRSVQDIRDELRLSRSLPTSINDVEAALRSITREGKVKLYSEVRYRYED